MNRNVMILAGAIVVAGIAAGILLAGGLSSNGNLAGALYDDTPGPWLYQARTIVGNPAMVTGPGALFIVEQRHEQLATSAGGTVGADCYIVAPMYYNAANDNAQSLTFAYYFPLGRQSDMLALASSVEAAPAVLKKVTSSNAIASDYVSGCVPSGTGVNASVTNAALVGTTVVRNSKTPWTCGAVTDYTSSNVGFAVASLASVPAAGASGGTVQIPCFALHPGVRLAGTWRFWNEQTLYAPVDYVRANYHPV